MISPRYLIANMLLPAFVREQGAALVHDAIARGDDEFFIPVWAQAGIRFSPRFLDMTRGDYRVGVMTLPTPREMCEAYFAAVVSKTTDPASARYFILELGTSSADHKATTVIGEWAESRHLNFGAGPSFTGDLAADRGAFVDRVLKLCDDGHGKGTG